MEMGVYLLEYIRQRTNYDSVQRWLDNDVFLCDEHVAIYRAIKQALSYGDCKQIDYPQIVTLIQESEDDPALWADCQKVLRQMSKVRARKTVVERMAQEFLRAQHTQMVLGDASEQLGGRSKFDINKVITSLRQIESIGTSDGVSHDVFSNPDARLQDFISLGKPVPTPISQLTKVLDGGPAGGETLTYIALPDGGKTLVLVDHVVTASEHQFPVFFGVAERGRVTLTRINSRIVGKSSSWIGQHPGEFVRQVQRKASRNAPIRVVDYSQREPSVTDLRRDVSKFVDDFGKLGLIVFDYGDLLRSSRNYEAKRMELDLVWKDLSRLSQEFCVPVITATQSNKAGFKANEIGMEHAAEAFAKMHTADMVISINSSKKEKESGRARLFIAKTKKSGGALTIPIVMDRLTCKINSIVGRNDYEQTNEQQEDSGSRRCGPNSENGQGQLTGGDWQKTLPSLVHRASHQPPQWKRFS